MKGHCSTALMLGTLTLIGFLALPGSDWSQRAESQEVPPPPGSSPSGDVETLLRGPLHEGFAEPVQIDPQPGIVVPKKPPEPIEEIPPAAKPTDENVVWLPGYWAWDETRDDFIYVSGVWRVPPADRIWVPGYWAEASNGYQRISGFWAPAEAEDITYLPYPPASLESGPTSPQPSSDYYWVSGCWVYRDHRYAWQPGYWDLYREGCVRVPAHYVWTPRGVIFVDTYCDYPFYRRGVVFAPVYFSRPVYVHSGYSYCPSVVVDVSTLLLHLFVHPRHCHYYWGDYYDHHHRIGAHAWFDYHGRHGYDPLFAYYDAHYRHQNIDYVHRLRGWHDYFQQHEDHRPAHTLKAQGELAVRAQRDANLKQSLLGQTLTEVMSDRDARVRFERVPEPHRASWARLAGQLHNLADQRVAVEARPGSQIRLEGRAEVEPKAETPKPDRLKLPDLPQMVRPAPALGDRRGPPDRPRLLGDSRPSSVEPKPSEHERPSFGPRATEPRLSRPNEPKPDVDRPVGPVEPRLETPRPRIETPSRPQPDGSRPRFRGLPDRPPSRIESPVGPRIEMPMLPRPNEPKADVDRSVRPVEPRLETPRPRIEMPSRSPPDGPRPRFRGLPDRPPSRIEQPVVPRIETPRTETLRPPLPSPPSPRPEPPRMPQPRFERSFDGPRASPTPRIEAPRRDFSSPGVGRGNAPGLRLDAPRGSTQVHGRGRHKD